MRILGLCCLAAIVLLPAPGAGASFSATGSAEVNRGIALHALAGATSPPSNETYWFHDLGDCPLCGSSKIPIAELGVSYGEGHFRVGLFGSFPGPQLELYGQLYEGRKMDLGVGARAGLPLAGWSAHQVFIRSDYRLRKNLKLLIDPGLYYQTGKSPNGWNEGSLLFFTQSLGLAFATSRVTFTPSVSLVTGAGDLKISSDPARHFRDTFATASIGVTFHRRAE